LTNYEIKTTGPLLTETRPFPQTCAQFAELIIDCANAEGFLLSDKRRENQ